MAKVVRFFDDVSITGGVGSGVLFTDLFGGIKYLLTGELQQVTIRRTDGSAAALNIQVRYISDNSNPEKLAYFYKDATFDADGVFVDSSIDAPFSLRQGGIDGYLSLYVESEVDDCDINIRLDFDVNNIAGV